MIEIEKELLKRYGKKIDVFQIWKSDYKDVYSFSLNEKALVVAVNKKKSMTRQYKTILSNELQQGLFLRGVNVPEVFDFFEVGKTLCAVHAYIEGVSPSDYTEKEMYEIGKTLGKLHLQTHHQSPYEKVFEKRYIFCAIVERTSKMLRKLKNLIIKKDYRELPSGICHLDLTPNNLIFNLKGCFLIDFDKQKKQPYVYEVYRFLKNRNTSENINSFMRGYLSLRDLSDKEKAYLFSKNINF